MTRARKTGQRKSVNAAPEISPNRRRMILDEAARLFGKHGFDATPMREIAAAVDITPAALYWYFDSKEKLFYAVNEAGMSTIHDAVVRAIEGIDDPWERLMAAAETHCTLVLESRGHIALVVPSTLGPIRKQLVAQRDRYGALFSNLIAALDLREGVDPAVFRLQLLAGLTSMLSWYRKSGRFTARQLARQYVEMLAYGVARTRQKTPHGAKSATAAHKATATA